MKKYILMLSVFAFGLGACAQSNNNEVVTAEQLNAVLEEINVKLYDLEQKSKEMDCLKASISSIAEMLGGYSSEHFEKYGIHEYVDLGLPTGTLWATCNLGAESPEEYGDYFAWGETKPQADHRYSWASYSYCDGSDDSLNKYCTDSSYGTVDNKTELEPADDAATANWGEDWQIPSGEQLTELVKNTTSSSVILNGVKGRLVTSKVEGYTDKSIFFPAAGYYKDGQIDKVENASFFWLRKNSEKSEASSTGFYLDINPTVWSWGTTNRCEGLSIRPVRVFKRK